MTKTATQTIFDAVEPSGSSNSRMTQFYAQLIAEHSTDPIAILDAAARVEWVNHAYEQVTGYSLEETVGRMPGETLTGPKTDRTVLRELMRAGPERRSIRREVIQYRRSGEEYWSEILLTPIIGDDDEISHYLVVARDVSDRKALERDRELARQTELLRQAERRVLAKTTEWLYAARSLEDLYEVVECCAPKLMPMSSGALYIYSNSRDILELAVSWGETPPPNYIEPDDCWALRRGRAYHYGTEEIEFPCGHYHDDVDSSFCLPLLAHGETIGMLWCHASEKNSEQVLDHARFWDVALMLGEQVSLTIANVRLRQELQDRSIKDPLTGLWNRRYFLDSLRREKARADSNELGFALISIDIDHFKRFNDHHGHDAGDLVLRRVSTELVEAAGVAGIVCRVGGEELAVICPDLDEQAAMVLANKLHNSIKRLEIVYQGEILPCVTFSAGVSTYPSDHSSIDDLMRNADNALYQAKHAGRDRIMAYKNDDAQRWVLAKETQR
jgi:diguanylate cyclase (GGDEF)-like protein/PAS domain S-box-containing protein